MKSPIIWLAIAIMVFVSSSCVFNIQDEPVFSARKTAPLSRSAGSTTHQPMEEVMSQNLIPAEIEPLPNQANQAALVLQRLGFKILHIGPTISVQAPRSLWESTLNVSFTEENKTVIAEIESEETYFKALTDNLVIPEELESVISEVMFVEPPEFFQGQP